VLDASEAKRGVRENSMTESETRIVIRHLSGSKANQIDQFDLAGLTEITLGRDPKSTVAYDLQRDDEVSRRHAVIHIKNDKDKLYFRLADLNSSNGTMLNGERIGGECELLPEDVVELGAGGPKFSFDIQPRPVYLPARTRAMTAMDPAATRLVTVGDAPEIGATAEHSAVDDAQLPVAVTTTGTMTRVPIGKATIMRMLTDERRSTRQVWIAALAGVLVLAVLGGGALYWHSQSVANQLQQEVNAQALRADAIRSEAASALAKQAGLTPADIKKYGDSTVYIHNLWQLYDRETNQPIFQKMTNVNGEWLPAYVRMNDGKLVRWLTLENDKDSFYKPVGKDHSGSGFVIGENGFILTNKHVAAGWTSAYEDFPYYNWTRGTVWGVGQSDQHDTERNVNLVHSLSDWVPESGGYLFESGRPFSISNSPREFFGRNEELTVQFPGTRININATLLRTSIDADVAELKVDSTEALSKLELADDNSVQIGEKIVLLGYPGVSQETIAVQKSSEGGQIRERAVYIPEPTVTEGIVAKMPTAQHKDQGDVATFGTTGDTYQLDIFAGPGHSGGPVLDPTGKVIALLSLVSTTAQHVSFAVPVSYVRELLQPQRNASP
jgi:serine protease Do